MNLSSIEWDVETVQYWLGIAAMVDRSLPPVMPPKVSGQKWNIIREWYEFLWDKADDVNPRMQPTNEQISMWEEVVLRWFKLIDSDKDKKIVWMRACGVSYSRIGKKVSLSRQTLTRRYQTAINKLVISLNNFYHKIG